MALAQYETGNTLLSKLRNNKSDVGVVDRMFATGYIIGVADTFVNVTFCPQDGMTVGQIVDVVRNFLEENPEVRHRPADLITEIILRHKFPCKTEKKPNGRGA